MCLSATLRSEVNVRVKGGASSSRSTPRGAVPYTTPLIYPIRVLSERPQPRRKREYIVLKTY
jgi:hypothetical protein